MKATKQKTVGAVSELNPRIDKCIELQTQIAALTAALNAERTCVKDIMEHAKLERYATAVGNEALVIGTTTFTWNAAALESELSEDEFEELCPRKPVGEKLRKRFDSDKDFAARVKKCFKRSNKNKLELRAKGAEPASENVTPIEDAA
jgi:hypothetical protein